MLRARGTGKILSVPLHRLNSTRIIRVRTIHEMPDAVRQTGKRAEFAQVDQERLDAETSIESELLENLKTLYVESEPVDVYVCVCGEVLKVILSSLSLLFSIPS